MKSIKITFCLLMASVTFSKAQIGTAETRMLADTTTGKTSVGGYGNAFYSRNNNDEVATMNLERFVLFVGHKFNSKWALFSELEVEDAKLEAGSPGGELALEQCFIQYSRNANHFWRFGLFIPQFGFLNTNHLPGDFHGNERTRVESLVIPSTWRELGVSYIGNSATMPLQYNISLVNGLNASAFQNGNGIREGRYEGRNASANNLALTASANYQIKDFKLQASIYYGGSIPFNKRESDSLQLESGFFGSPVAMGEFCVKYTSGKFTFKALATAISITNAASINRAFANNTPSMMFGTYGELAYQIAASKKDSNRDKLFAFARYEKLDLNADIPNNGVINPTLDQSHLIIGFSYFPTNNVVFKADARFSHTGPQNPDLFQNVSPTAPAYLQDNSFINLGLGYSF